MDSSSSTILRIEHPETGEGPYGPIPSQAADTPLETAIVKMCMEHRDPKSHPSLPKLYKQHKVRAKMSRFFSGFENKEQAFDWFGREYLEVFIDSGFDLLAFESKGKVLKDGRQIAFLREKSERVDSGWHLIGLS